MNTKLKQNEHQFQYIENQAHANLSPHSLMQNLSSQNLRLLVGREMREILLSFLPVGD